jgi:hypothetical protein
METKMTIALLAAGLIGMSPRESSAARLTYALAETRVILNGEQEGRILLDFEPLLGLDGKWISSAFIHLPLSGLASPEDLEIQPCAVTTSWTGRSVTWTTPWESPGGDLESSSPAITIEAGRAEDTIQVDVSDEVRSMVSGRRPAHGLALSVPLWRGEDGFSLSERTVLGSLEGATLVVTFTNSPPRAVAEGIE